jgi:hypothetical protein
VPVALTAFCLPEEQMQLGGGSLRSGADCVLGRGGLAAAGRWIFKHRASGLFVLAAVAACVVPCNIIILFEVESSRMPRSLLYANRWQ